jgi:hypothetical protein
MYRYRHRFLFTLLCVILLCSTAQATNLLITVQDNIDNSTIPHAAVFVDGADYARTNNGGQVLYAHSGLNDHLIRVSMTGYDDWEKSIGRNETSVFVNLSRKSLTLKITLFDSDTLGPIAGAQVNISADNRTQGKLTDAAGSATFGVNATTLYSVDIKAASYQPRTVTIDMGTENKNDVQYSLLSGNRFSFVVTNKDTKAPIQGAEVRINTILAGKTDERGILISSVKRGQAYTIEITKDGYGTSSESKTISESDAVDNVELSKAPLGAFVYVFDEANAPLNGADIYINGTLSGTSNQYGRGTFPNLVSGPYNVEVRKPGYVSISRTIIVSNKSEDYTFNLAFENADLTIFVQDKDQKNIASATIFLNSNNDGVTDDHGQYLAKVKFNTLYNITASKDGYKSSSVQKQVAQGNATDSLTITLEKSMDWGLIGMIVVGAVAVLILFAAIRMFGRRKRRHIMRRNEI